MSIIVATSLPTNLSRRSFMKSILALAAAPAIVHVANLMPVRQVVAATEADFQRVAALSAAQIDKIWSTRLIKEFYEKVAYARIRGTLDEAWRDVTEQDLFKAVKEGRVKQDGHDNWYRGQWGHRGPATFKLKRIEIPEDKVWIIPGTNVT